VRVVVFISVDGIVYYARNKVNGKGYVGQTTLGLEIRRRLHTQRTPKRASCLSLALNKYGEESFTWRVLSRVSSREELNFLEDAWIVALGTLAPNGYNLMRGGDNRIKPGRHKCGIPWNKGIPMSPGARIKSSESHRKFYLEHPGVVESVASKRRGSVVSLETRKLMSEGQKRAHKEGKGLEHPKSRRRFCLNGHDTSAVGRSTSGNCKECARAVYKKGRLRG
jgi:group I intron endonuclease